MEMNGLNQSGYVNSVAAGYQNVKSGKENRYAVEEEAKAKDSGLNDVGGRTIGEPKLSDKALKYYEQLKRKYSNMDFILVSPEKKQEAERMKGMYPSSKELLVLIDSDKIEKMAEDDEYRKKYEGILSGATTKMAQMKKSLGSNADSVKSFGMTFNDHGNASFFAVVDKSLALQKERIADKHAENVKKKKKEAKKAEKKKAEETAEEKRTDAKKKGEDNSITVTASSWDELLQKINTAIKDTALESMSDRVRTEEEKSLGQSVDFSL